VEARLLVASRPSRGHRGRHGLRRLGPEHGPPRAGEEAGLEQERHGTRLNYGLAVEALDREPPGAAAPDVLDERGDFAERRCNTVGVDLDPLADEDIALLHGLISTHAELTQSPRAKWILECWEQMLPSFVKVFPHEYKRVLARPQEVLHG